MANTTSAVRAARQAVRLTVRNQSIRTRVKTLHKKFSAAAKGGNAAAAKQAGIAYVAAMDKAAKVGVVHKNAASRAKAHAAKFIFAK
jgi:small subunit ribosomal protein S20